MKKLRKYLKGYGYACVLGPLFKLFEAMLELLIPLVVAQIVDRGITGGDTSYVTRMCVVMVALGVLGLLASVTAQYFSAAAAVGFATRLRHALLEHLLGMSYTQLDRLGTSTMITRMTSDVNQVQNGLNLTLRLLLRSPFVVFGAMVMAFTIDVKAALVFVGLIPVLCLVVFGIMLVTMPMYKGVQAALDGVTTRTRQNLAGVRVLRAFRKETAEVSDFEEQTQQLTRRQLKAGGISALMNPVTYVIVNLAIVALVRTGAVQVELGILSQGMVIALYNYMSQILVELIKMANLIITMTKALACADRVAGVLDIPQETGTGSLRQELSGKVTFRDVTARYDGAGQPSLEHISFTAQPGQTVGIIGGTGSGKTTLVNLIPGLYPAAQGQVLLDDVDIRTYDSDSVMAQIGLVPQKAVLFRGSIRENLLWGNPQATEDQLWQALDTAQAREVVKSKPGELDAQVEQGGVNFSGGQRQRLTIARALLKKPKILILDDSTSAVDTHTDMLIREAFQKKIPDTTRIIISQRVSSIQDLDQILVLDNGRIAGLGTHEELLKTNEIYRQTYEQQQKGGDFDEQ